MKSNRNLALATLTAVAVLGAASGASAAGVDVTFTVSQAAGGLAVSTGGTTTANAGSSSFSGTVGSITGDLPDLTVTDARGSVGATWDVKVVAEAQFDDGADHTTADGTNSVAASNAVVFLPLAGVAYNATTGAAARAASLTTDLGASLSFMTITDCVCDADGVTALSEGRDLGGPAYSLATGTTTAVSSASVVLSPDIHISVPANTPAANYTAQVTFSVI